MGSFHKSIHTCAHWILVACQAWLIDACINHVPPVIGLNLPMSTSSLLLLDRSDIHYVNLVTYLNCRKFVMIWSLLRNVLFAYKVACCYECVLFWIQEGKCTWTLVILCFHFPNLRNSMSSGLGLHSHVKVKVNFMNCLKFDLIELMDDKHFASHLIVA